MKPVAELKQKHSDLNIKYLFTDIDDTLTDEGQLRPEAYASLWSLYESGIKVIPITGRPAGWCEMIARFWPVSGVIGENGALYFCYKNKQMHRNYIFNEDIQKENKIKLQKIESEILQKVPGSAVSSDQFCRLFDLAIDFCEDVPALPQDDVKKIVDIFESHGAVAKVSSIHVNGWFGDYDKLSMCKTFMKNEFNIDLDNNEEIQNQIVFSGDSPNDEPMFAYFKHSVAVANIKPFLSQLKSPPAYITNSNGGKGFTELAQLIL